MTKRQRFLGEMEKFVTWLRLLEPYHTNGEQGRRPIGLKQMLRIYFLQQCFRLSGEGLEDALYDSIAMRAFAGIDMAVENAPDVTTLLKFRRLLVDATIIEAPPSTKKAGKSRDPEMYHTEIGKEWHFAMKFHKRKLLEARATSAWTNATR